MLRHPHGRVLARAFLDAVAFRDARTHVLVPTGASGQLAFAADLAGPPGDLLPANSLLVFGLAQGRTAELVRFDPSVVARFDLPAALEC